MQIYAFVYLLGAVGIVAYYVYLVSALMGGYWLTAVVFTPLLGALFVLAQPEERAIWRAGFIFSLHPARDFALSLRRLRRGHGQLPVRRAVPRGFRSSGSRITSGSTVSACSWCF